jgi:hypothetical protein
VASYTDHREALGYIITDLYLQMNRAKSLDDINIGVLLLEGLCSNFTEDDTRYKEEWRLIQADRHAATQTEDYRQGNHAWQEEDMAYRMMEYKTLTRAADRNGVLRHNPTPRTTWKPEATE